MKLGSTNIALAYLISELFGLSICHLLGCIIQAIAAFWKANQTSSSLLICYNFPVSFSVLMSIPQELSDDAVTVLMVLWKERFNVDFMNEGLTPEEIRQKASYSGIKPIYEAINELLDRSDRWPTLLEVKPRSQSEGRRPKCYKLYTDGVSDWPRSSFLLMELNYYDKKRRRQIDAGEFCRHLLANCAFRDQDDLDTIVAGLCSLDYLYRSPNLPTLAGDKHRGYLLLSLNERSRLEKEFIRQVAEHYPHEVEKDGRAIKHSFYLIATGHYTYNK